MTLDELETFACIAQLGSFTEASRKLGRSQPAITRRIRQLEGSLGFALFERHGRRPALTDAGLALLPHAQAALASARDGERAVRDLAVSGHGAQVLKVAIVGTLADSHLVDALRAFEARFPKVSIELRTANSREVSAFVRSGEVQLGLRYFPDADPRLESSVLGSEELVVVVAATHPIEQRRLRDLRKLEGERWLGFPAERGQPESFGQLLERTLAAAGFAGASFTAVDSLTAQKRLVQAGLGVALMPRSSVREELRIGSLRAIEIERLGAELPVVVVRRRDAYESPLVRDFRAVLQDYVPHLTGRARPRRHPAKRRGRATRRAAPGAPPRPSGSTR